jgi:hypothetical protein
VPSQHIDLKQLEKEVWRESLQDGLMEIAIGIIMYFCGCVIADPKIMVIYVAWLAYLPLGLRAIKKRYIYPRLGQVVLRHEKPKPLFTGVLITLGLVTLIATGLGVFGRLTSPESYRWLPLCLGLCLAAAFGYVYSRSGSLRYLIYAFVALGAAVVVSSIRLPSAKDYVAVYLICTGTLAGVTGGITLRRFLRTHPLTTQEVSDDNARA